MRDIISLFAALVSTCFLSFSITSSADESIELKKTKRSDHATSQSAITGTSYELIALKEKLSSLELVTDRQKMIIDDLQAKVNLYEEKPLEKNITYPVWTSILLGASALLMTIVGIGIAVFSFIGYKQIVRKGVRAAEKAASRTAKEATAKGIDDSVMLAIGDLKERGYFEPIVNELVQKFMYRGIQSDDLDADENEKEHSRKGDWQ